MKLLPCSSPNCAPLGALWPRTPAYPNGEPAVTGQYVREYRCERCRRNNIIGLVDYNRLPELTLEDFKRIAALTNAPALANLPTKDWMSQGATRNQAEDLFRSGLHDTNAPEVRGRDTEA